MDEQMHGRLEGADQCGGRTRDAAPPSPFLSVEDLLKSERAKVDWVLPGYLGRGLTTLLVADPKAGKTTFVLGALAALEQAGSFLGIKHGPAKAIVLTEEPLAAVAERVTSLGLTQLRVLPRHEHHGRQLDAVVDLALTDADRHGAKVLVVDTLAFWAGLGPEAENDAGAVREAFAPVLNAADAGMAVWLVHHARKAGGAGTSQSRGSSALPGAVDIHMSLAKRKGGPASLRVVDAVGRFGATPERAHYAYVDKAILPVPAGVDPGRFIMRHRVLSYMEAHGLTPATAGEIQRGAAGRRQDVLDAIRDLVSAGALQELPGVGTGFLYRVTDVDSPVPGSLPLEGEPGTATPRGPAPDLDGEGMTQ